jgi:1,2-diacylglycerol 3-alpha-glucosyltransferase
MKKKLKILLYMDIAILLIFISYKCYLFAFERDFESFNINGIKVIQNEVAGEAEFSFAVLGNIKNSIVIFDKKMVQTINADSDIDFVISTGNAVLDGSEDKYRIFNKSIHKINAPALAVIGGTEASDGGAFRFYKHFGPFYYSFHAADTYFIVLDTTGQTSEYWQEEWLKTELEHGSKYKHTFVFLNKPPYIIENKAYRDYLMEMFSKYDVEAVFASGPEIYDERNIDGVKYFTSGGGGGGLLLNNKNSFFHYIKVAVTEDQINYEVVKEENPSTFILQKALENLWIYIHSIFYINFPNYIMILCILALLTILIYLRVSKEVDYYRSYDDIQTHVKGEEKLAIAMFTDNYFPFLGGVPISIHRLAKGLRKEGHTVYIFAPKYPGSELDEDPFIIRCNLITYYKTKIFNFPIINIFSSKIEKEFVSHGFDIVHVHHPFWMGSKGLKLGKKYKLPVVLTYHTRLDSYYHYLPVFQLLFKNVVSHKIIKRFSQKCSAIIAPSESAKEYLANIGVSRPTVVLPTGMNPDYYENIPNQQIQFIKDTYAKDNGFLLCSVSRLSSEKNIYFLLEGIKYIKKNTTVSFTCIIIGDGPEKENLLKTINEYQLQDTITLVGAVNPEEISAFYMASDLFLFSSKSETQGMVLLEAMAGGCPVVAVTSSGIDDVIKNDYNGYKTTEHVEVWSDQVINLLTDQEKLMNMSKNAYSFSKLYSVQAMAAKSAEVYSKAIYDNDNKLSRASVKHEAKRNDVYDG